MKKRSFLVSTFKRVLKITLTDDGDLTDCYVMAEGQGVYFGLAQAKWMIFIAERNLDINKQTVTSDAPENTIRLYFRMPRGKLFRTPIWYGSEAFDDLHQIAYDHRRLFVTSGEYPFLFRRSILSRQIDSIDLAHAIPEHLRKPDVEGRDAYHFNSVSLDGDSLLVLAHNWDQPSFALRLSLEQARRGRAVALACYEGLGSCCHDILAVGDAIWCLDSGGSALVRIDPNDGSRQGFPLTSPAGEAFPRGLGVFGNRLLVTYGLNSKNRADRMESASMLALFDLDRCDFTRHVALGSHGNTCAVLPF